MEIDPSRVLDALPALTWTALHDGRIDFVSQRWRDYTGISIDDALGWGWKAAIDPRDLAEMLESWQSIRASGEPGEMEARLRRFDGAMRWFRISVNPRRDAAGRIVKWYAVNLDDEDRRHAEKAARRRELRFRTIVDSIPVPVAVTTPTGEVEGLNRATLDYFGKPLDELKGWRTLNVVHPDDLQQTVSSLMDAHRTGSEYNVESRHRRADGVYRWYNVRGFPLRDKRGRILRWLHLLIDIDDRKRAEEEQRRSEAFLAEGQRLSSTGSFSWRADADDVTFSDELYRIFEYEPPEPMTIGHVAARIHPEDKPWWLENLALIRAGGGDHAYEVRLKLLDDRVKYLRVVARLLRHPGDRLEYLGTVQDITERHLAETALSALRSELTRVTRVTSLGMMTASIAHEVNQPLSGIVTNASTCLRLLAADPPNVDGARETARRTIRDGNRAADVIARLRALFTRKATLVASVDLNDAAQEVVALLRSDLQRSGVILRTEYAEDLPLVDGDRIQLQQVIMNLVRNAVEAMNEVDDRPRQLLIRTEADQDDHVRLTVQDAGTGFVPQRMARLFEAFYTTKHDGMGIGLSVSRWIIESHHGRLWAELNDGPGVRFSFSLPEHAETATQNDSGNATIFAAGNVRNGTERS